MPHKPERSPSNLDEKGDDSSLQNDALLKEILTLFMRTETVVRGTRITRKGDVVQPVDDLAAGLEGIMRVFQFDRDAVKASTMVSQLQSQLSNRFKEWEAETQRIQRSKVEVHNSPSGDQLRKMAAENSAVKTSVSTTLAKMRALNTALAQFQCLDDNEQASPNEPRDEFPVEKLSDHQRLIFQLIGVGLDIRAENAQKIGFGTRVREQVIDRKKSLFLVVQWSPSDKMQLCFKAWLVPKSPQALKRLRKGQVIFRCQANRQRIEATLPFAWTRDSEEWPQKQEIVSFLKTVQNVRFGDSALDILKAEVELSIPFADAVLDETFSLTPGFVQTIL